MPEKDAILYAMFLQRLAAAAVLAAAPIPVSEAIRPESLRGHVAFLASDRLGGRPTPSAEGDLAAEYVAAQFRRAGLQPVGDDEYFQTIAGAWSTLREDGYAFSVTGPEGTTEVPAAAFRLAGPRALDLDGARVVRARPEAIPAELPPGAALVLDLSESPKRPPLDAYLALREAVGRAAALRPAALVVAGEIFSASRFGRRAIVEPPSFFDLGGTVVGIGDASVAAAVARAASAPDARLRLRVAEPQTEPFTMRNVAGVLPGSDPALRERHVLVSAHYDGTGPDPRATGPDRVWNAANDDASGVAAVIDVAAALSARPARPRRSVIFVAFAGEETGLRGSSHYARHPLVPLEKTVAALNLEQLGRTDGAAGTRRAWASITGWDYSTLPAVFERAGAAAGVRVEKDAKRSDAFFPRSDNWPLAASGVVAHTLSVLFEDFTDAHSPADEWRKIDFDNMAGVVRVIADGVRRLADGEEPLWREGAAEARPYRDAAARRGRR
jgi:hypothetical protein